MGQANFTMQPRPRGESGVNSIRINQDRNGFIIATDRGIKTFWIDPLQVLHILEVREVGCCKVAEWAGDTRLCGMACGPEKGVFPDTQVKTVDMQLKKIQAEAFYNSPVLGIRFVIGKSFERLIAILHDEIHIQLYKGKLPALQILKTGPNPKGLCELSRNKILVCPAPNRGQVQIVDLNQITEETTATPVIIQAHEAEIACLAISKSGTYMATASQKGTLLRVYHTSTKKKELELRRGCDTAIVYSISFSPCDQFVGVCSDKGTVHIFAVKDPSLNHTNMLNQVGTLLPSNLGKPFEGQKSLAQFTIQDECPSVITFLDHQTIVAITMEGEYLKYVFTTQGQCKLKILAYILDMGDDFPLRDVGPLKSNIPPKKRTQMLESGQKTGKSKVCGSTGKKESECVGKDKDENAGKRERVSVDCAEKSKGGLAGKRETPLKREAERSGESEISEEREADHAGESKTVVKIKDEISGVNKTAEISGDGEIAVKIQDEISEDTDRETAIKIQGEISGGSETAVKTKKISGESETAVKIKDEISGNSETAVKIHDEISGESETAVKIQEEISGESETAVKTKEKISGQSDTVVKTKDEISGGSETAVKTKYEISGKSETAGKREEESNRESEIAEKREGENHGERVKAGESDNAGKRESGSYRKSRSKNAGKGDTDTAGVSKSKAVGKIESTQWKVDETVERTGKSESAAKSGGDFAGKNESTGKNESAGMNDETAGKWGNSEKRESRAKKESDIADMSENAIKGEGILGKRGETAEKNELEELENID